VRLGGSGFDDGGDAGVPSGDGVHDEIRRSAVISRAWSASPFASSGEAERWLEQLRRPWASVVDEVLDSLWDKINQEY
jgi:hypothetical protein